MEFKANFGLIDARCHALREKVFSRAAELTALSCGLEPQNRGSLEGCVSEGEIALVLVVVGLIAVLISIGKPFDLKK